MKLKERLIHLLGGYTYKEHKQFNIVKCEKPVLTLRSVLYLPDNPTEADIDYCKQELAYQIAEELMNKRLIMFELNNPEKVAATVRVVDMT